MMMITLKRRIFEFREAASEKLSIIVININNNKQIVTNYVDHFEKKNHPVQESRCREMVSRLQADSEEEGGAGQSSTQTRSS